MPVPFAIRIQRKNRKYITVHPNYTNEKVEYNTLYGQSIYGIRIGGQSMDENRLRNIKTYVVANEIGFIVLWILSWYLFRSDYGEYLIFHGAKPYTLDTTGGIFLQNYRTRMGRVGCANLRNCTNIFHDLEEERCPRHVSLRQLYVLWRQLVYGGGHGVQHMFLRSDVLQCRLASG